MYQKGKGVPQDYKTAVKWYTLAAKQGLAAAQFNLGMLYYMEKGPPQDDKTALKWLKLSAKQGLVHAQYYLGTMYIEGSRTLGIPSDAPRAYLWWNIAALQGNKMAKRDLLAWKKFMSPTQIETAQRLARECMKKNYKGC